MQFIFKQCGNSSKIGILIFRIASMSLFNVSNLHTFNTCKSITEFVVLLFALENVYVKNTVFKINIFLLYESYELSFRDKVYTKVSYFTRY